MTIGEIYDKFELINNLITERDAYLYACYTEMKLTKDDINYVAKHHNIRAPKKGTKHRQYYEEINNINEKIASLRKEVVHINKIDIDDD